MSVAAKSLVFYRLALASRAAEINVKTPNGTLNAKIVMVCHCPKDGSPEESSNTQPTTAINAMQENKSKIPLFVGMTIKFSRLALHSAQLVYQLHP